MVQIWVKGMPNLTDSVALEISISVSQKNKIVDINKLYYN